MTPTRRTSRSFEEKAYSMAKISGKWVGFTVTRPIKDERGVLNNATTHFRFVAGQDNANGTIDRPRASLVLATS